jgi:hypothetical protein
MPPPEKRDVSVWGSDMLEELLEELYRGRDVGSTGVACQAWTTGQGSIRISRRANATTATACPLGFRAFGLDLQHQFQQNKLISNSKLSPVVSGSNEAVEYLNGLATVPSRAAPNLLKPREA